MNKNSFAKLLIETIDNSREIGSTENEVLDSVKGLLSTLVPMDYVSFARWGNIKEKSTPTNCWNMQED